LSVPEIIPGTWGLIFTRMIVIIIIIWGF
jgi:hypothetical protein